MKIRISESTGTVIYRSKQYPVKDKSFLKGKLASYANEMGLEDIATVTKDGIKYKIYDTGIGNISTVNKCAVPIDESLTEPRDVSKAVNDAIDDAYRELKKYNLYPEICQYYNLPIIEVIVRWGDWKHDHWAIRDILEEMGFNLITSEVTEDDGSDTYSANHYFTIPGIIPDEYYNLTESKKSSSKSKKTVKEAKIKNIRKKVVIDEGDLDIVGATLLTTEEAEQLPKRLRDCKDWWHLQPSSNNTDFVPYVNSKGFVINRGYNVPNSSNVVRPALMISNLESSNLQIGDTFEFGDKEFEIISNDKAFCLGNIGRCAFRKDYKASDANDYEKSDVKKFIDNWFNQHKGEEIEVTESKKRNIKEAIGDDDPIRAWVGNLGKYNEGELVGEWIDLPISKADYEAMLKRIGIGSADDFGNPYEETFVADYDDPYGFVYDQFGEYPNMIELNAMAKAIEDMKSKRVLNEFNAMIEASCGDFWECVGNALDMTCYLVEGDDWSDLARYYIDEVDGGVENLPQEEIENNFDFEALGRDLSFDSYEDDDGNDISAGMYWCGDDDATDQEIGEAYVEAVGFDGVSNPENYFDYDSYGHDFQYDEYEITDEGILAYYNFDSSLGDDYREQYEEEIRTDWDIEEESVKNYVQESFFDDSHMGYSPNVIEYKGYTIEPSWLGDGYTVVYAGDEIQCDTVAQARKTIDSLIEFDDQMYSEYSPFSARD